MRTMPSITREKMIRDNRRGQEVDIYVGDERSLTIYYYYVFSNLGMEDEKIGKLWL
jgi:hypothetical protein